MKYLEMILSMVKEWIWYDKIIFYLTIPIVLGFFLLAIIVTIEYIIVSTNNYIAKNCDNICYKIDGFSNNVYKKYYYTNNESSQVKHRKR